MIDLNIGTFEKRNINIKEKKTFNIIFVKKKKKKK